MTRPAVVCLTPVKNEAWILDRFLACAALWADHVVVADQQSTDGSREIVARHAKARLIDNPAAGYDEAQRQRLLIEAARAFPGPKLLVALDADEFLSANFVTAADWNAALSAAPGTVIEFPRVELLPGATTYFRHSARDAGQRFPYGFVDDGSEHHGSPIHSPRVPVPDGAPRLGLTETCVLHFQFCDAARMESKHRWYRCFERLKYPDRSRIAIHRTYDWFERAEGDARPCPAEWLRGYADVGIDLTTAPPPGVYWWDWEVLRMFAAHGPRHFRGQDIWRADWEAVRRQGEKEAISGLPAGPIENPQTVADRTALWLLRRTGKSRLRRVVDKLLERIW